MALRWPSFAFLSASFSSCLVRTTAPSTLCTHYCFGGAGRAAAGSGPRDAARKRSTNTCLGPEVESPASARASRSSCALMVQAEEALAGERGADCAAARSAATRAAPARQHPQKVPSPRGDRCYTRKIEVHQDSESAPAPTHALAQALWACQEASSSYGQSWGYPCT